METRVPERKGERVRREEAARPGGTREGTLHLPFWGLSCGGHWSLLVIVIIISADDQVVTFIPRPPAKQPGPEVSRPR